MHNKEFEYPTLDLALFFGSTESNLKLVKRKYPSLKIVARDHRIQVSGDSFDLVSSCEADFNKLAAYLTKYGVLNTHEVTQLLGSKDQLKVVKIVQGVGGSTIKAKTVNQKEMVKAISEKDMLFAVGPAGTGKTYTAVALAVRALKEKSVKRIVLTRPAVEADEKLGFLPGDLKDKLDPYLQPLYDALKDMIAADKLAEHMQNNVIQIAPLAYMRGRTLNDAFVILDESQNTTERQMKMFLTRMGPTSKFIITGDPSQIDLPRTSKSGLVKAIDILHEIEDIAFVYLNEVDVLRHKLVTRINKLF